MNCDSWVIKSNPNSLNNFPIIFVKLQTLGVKISPKVYLKYTLYLCVCLKCNSITVGQNTSRCIHNLWNSIVVWAQVYQNQRSLIQNHGVAKNCICLSSFKGQSNKYERFLGTPRLKVSPHCDSAALRQLNSTHKEVNWEKGTVKKSQNYFVNYTWTIFLKYSWNIPEACLKYTFLKLT